MGPGPATSRLRARILRVLSSTTFRSAFTIGGTGPYTEGRGGDGSWRS